jgi:hypothetical protein
MDLYTKAADSVIYDNLFVGDQHTEEVQVKSVNLQAGQGVLKRGTVVGIINASGLAVAVDSTKADGSQTADSILTDDVDTTAGNTVTTTYASGTFNRKALIFGGTDTADKHETMLRQLGIFLRENISY